MEESVPLNIIDVDPHITVYNFDESILGNQIFFHVIRLSESFHIFVGTAAVQKNMAVAMQTKYQYDKGSASGSILCGDVSDPVSLNMALKLGFLQENWKSGSFSVYIRDLWLIILTAKQTGKQVYVSCSLPTDPNLIFLVEKRISEEIKKYPARF